MKNIIIFGYGYQGTGLAKKIYRDEKYNLLGFADNSIYKQGNYVYDAKILSMEELVELKKSTEFSVIIACEAYYKDIITQCLDNDIDIEGVYLDGRIKSYPFAEFKYLDLSSDIKLYAGDIADDVHLNDPNLYGLSITQHDDKHIFHDITTPYPLPDGCIASYEAECVLELINQDKLIFAINEIYRILKPGGYLRITVPDHYSPYLKRRAMRDKDGNVLYDAGETSLVKYGKNGIEGGWTRFTNYDDMKSVLEKTNFKDIKWLCYHTIDGTLHKENIDYSKGYNKRIINTDEMDQYNLLIDCIK